MKEISVFRILKKDKKSLARWGKLKTEHGEIETPFFMPCATKGAVKALSSDDLKEVGTQIILSNTYHLFLKPGPFIIKKAGGLHKFMNWSRPILTDSGGFQIFSLQKGGLSHAFSKGQRVEKVRVSDEGVKFKSEIDGTEIFLSCEKAIMVQQDLGSDIAMVLDECVTYPCSYDYAKLASLRTFLWAQRSKKEIKKFRKPPLVFGIVQGSTYKDLRIQSAKEITSLDFDGYAIGGLACGETKRKMWQVVRWVLPYLPQDKPRYLMGVGYPEDILKAVSLGIDMFDCVIPTRNARHGYLFTNLSKVSLSNPAHLKYKVIRITNKKYSHDFSTIDPGCGCRVCQNGYSKSYLRHLFLSKESLALRLATIHNLYFYLEFMRKIRDSI